MSSQNPRKCAELMGGGFGRGSVQRAVEGCQATVPAGDEQAEDSECSGQAQEASLISQGQVEGLTARRSSRAQTTSQNCTGSIRSSATLERKSRELRRTREELHHPSPLPETLVLPTALGRGGGGSGCLTYSEYLEKHHLLVSLFTN